MNKMQAKVQIEKIKPFEIEISLRSKKDTRLNTVPLIIHTMSQLVGRLFQRFFWIVLKIGRNI